MKKQIFKMGIMLTLVCPVLFSLTACGIGTAENQQELVKVTRGKIVLSVTGEGVLTLPQHRKLTFGTTGEILAVNVEEGDRVTKGQVLAKLDATTLQRMVKNAELAVATAELAVTTAELAVNTAEVDIRVAENGIKAAEIELEQATDNYRKITYPYTYATFLYDVPEARAKIRNARRQVDGY